jgi:hypothetical protein
MSSGSNRVSAASAALALALLARGARAPRCGSSACPTAPGLCAATAPPLAAEVVVERRPDGTRWCATPRRPARTARHASPVSSAPPGPGACADWSRRPPSARGRRPARRGGGARRVGVESGGPVGQGCDGADAADAGDGGGAGGGRSLGRRREHRAGESATCASCSTASTGWSMRSPPTTPARRRSSATAACRPTARPASTSAGCSPTTTAARPTSPVAKDRRRAWSHLRRPPRADQRSGRGLESSAPLGAALPRPPGAAISVGSPPLSRAPPPSPPRSGPPLPVPVA